MQINQQSNESLSQYVRRFREAVDTVTDLNIPQALEFFTIGLDMKKSRKLLKDIMFNPPKDLSEAYDKADNFIAIDDVMESLKSQSHRTDWTRDRDHDRSYNPRPDIQGKKGTRNRSAGNDRPSFRNWGVNKVYTPLNTDRAGILNEIKDKSFFEPCPVSNHTPKGDQSLFCQYHKKHGASTEAC